MIGQYFLEAYGVLAENRTRTILTLIGLVIGVAAVTTILIAGRGMAGAIEGSIGNLKDHSFIVTPNAQQADVSEAALRLATLNHIAQSVPGVTAVIPVGGQNVPVKLRHVHKILNLSAEGDSRYLTTPVRAGRYISTPDIKTVAHVCVISNDAYVKLAPDHRNVIGESVRIGDRRYEIIGVQAGRQTGIIPDVMRSDVLIPYTTFIREYLQDQPVYAAKFLLADGAVTTDAEFAVRAALRDLKGNRAEYQIVDRRSLTHTIEGITAAVTAAVALIGAISLFVAGIGILNIMLVSVAERTREIGLRKAIGASNANVLTQFFVEALLLSAIGCGAGLTVGLAAGWAVNTFALVKISGVTVPIPWLEASLTAAGCAALVAVSFGTVPAYNAARLDPIDALRYE